MQIGYDRDPMSRSNNKSDQVDRARRKLLKYSVYVPPAVIGALSLTEGGCQGASCGPNNCGPGGETPCPPTS